jgi:hypothetical protein
MEEIEVGGESELIMALRDHIETLKEEVARLRLRYEPLPLQVPTQTSPAQKPILRNRIRTSSALIEALERKTGVKNEVSS